MRCTSPITVWIPSLQGICAWHQKRLGMEFYPDLRPQFKKPKNYPDLLWRESTIPCGRCLGCLLDRREAWSVRATLEMMSHAESCFVTLTYAPEHLPINFDAMLPTLVRSDLTDFIKRLRRRLEPCRIRYFGCGEYGSKHDRPHYHLIVYGWCPQDIVGMVSVTVYRSKLLEELWPFGFSSFAPATPETIRYVAGYVTKKFGVVYPEGQLKPFVACSLKPALGYHWFQENKHDLFRSYYDQDCLCTVNTLRLPDGSAHPIPPVMRRWWTEDFRFTKQWKDKMLSQERSPPKVFDESELDAKRVLHEIFKKESEKKGKNNV